MNNGGDVLARGGKSATFVGGARSISSFHEDLIFRTELVAEKYGLTQEEVDQWIKKHEAGEDIPEMDTKATRDELAALKLSVVDKRPSYALPEAIPMAEVVAKYPPKEYTQFRTIMDRILIKRVDTDPDNEILSDGSVRNKKTGLITTPQYREHMNCGIVLAIGDYVTIGGTLRPLESIVQPGDRVYYGDYNSEVAQLDSRVVEALCDAVEMNYTEDEEGVRIVRIQDVRGIEKPIKKTQEGQDSE